MGDDWILRLPWERKKEPGNEKLLTREWLVTNGLGGYASGTIGGALTRGYHGLLIAALPVPLGRQMMLNHLFEWLRLPDGQVVLFGGEEKAGAAPALHGADYLTEFRLEFGLPVWRYEIQGIAFEKRVLLPHGQNTTYINYRLVHGPERSPLPAEEPESSEEKRAGGGARSTPNKVRLKLRPGVHFRSHDAPVSAGHPFPYRVNAIENRYELTAGDALPPLHMHLYGDWPAFTLDGKQIHNVLYRVESARGYAGEGDLWSPGYFRADLTRDTDVTVVFSTESWDTLFALTPQEAWEAEHDRRRRLIRESPSAVHGGPSRQLVLAADQFLITPTGRVEDAARARAVGDEVRTVIAGYHWFTDWGRDTMISLEGLTLSTGRYTEAGYILRTFSHAIRDGLIPNLFPEGESGGLYHTADATLWFFHAIDRYLEYTGDRNTLCLLLPKLKDIIDHHLRGTRFNIHVDPADGLLSQGAEGYQLTWMDAKVGDWVVTPRRGKAVEINALWYNALRLMERWIGQEEGDQAARFFREHADQSRESFNRKFWYKEGGYLYDVVDAEGGGNDPTCRPNQIFAFSLPHEVLDRNRWEPVFETVHHRLLTPVGLRSLAPGSPDYKPKYYGDLRARDAAYHQGTVWAWLIGPYVDAYLKLHPDDHTGGRELLAGLIEHLREACIGQISEIFDAEGNYTPRGCVAQAWSVAEALRCWLKTAENAEGSPGKGRTPEARSAAT
jgi:predicted glycogen debranching enzyme